MIIRKPKTRTIFCRICDEDYSRLLEVCNEQGESISDILRSAVGNLLGRDLNAESEVLARVRTLTVDLEAISQEATRIRGAYEQLVSLRHTAKRGDHLSHRSVGSALHS